VQHPLAEQIPLPAAIALPLQAFHRRDLAFDLPVTVRQMRHPVRRIAHAVTHAAKVTSAGLALARPSARHGQGGWLFVDESSGESAGQRIGRLKPLVVTSRLEELLVRWRQRLLWRSQEPDELPGRGSR